MNKIAVNPTNGCTDTGAANKPTNAVKTTNVITRGFRRAK
jgi:hypothetical protein